MIDNWKDKRAVEACLILKNYSMSKYEYIVSENGIIFRKCAKGVKEVPKRLSTRGVLEFKMNGKTTSYRKFVATKIIPNPNNCDKVFSKNGDPFDTRPENLKWVWTRENRKLSLDEALLKCTDSRLIEYYKTGDKRYLKREIDRQFEKIYIKLDQNFITELYLTIIAYGERNLLFNLENDFKQTYFGLISQAKRKKIKMIRIDNFNQIDKSNILNNELS